MQFYYVKWGYIRTDAMCGGEGGYTIYQAADKNKTSRTLESEKVITFTTGSTNQGQLSVSFVSDLRAMQ